MRRLLIVLALCVGLPTASAGDFFPFPVEQKTLANGLQVVAIPMPAKGLVAYRTVIRTGSRDEYEAGRSGFAHFFEHMMFRGTKKVPQELYNKLITQMGADTNAYTSSDLTVYQLNIAPEDLEKVMELESDRFQNLFYAKGDFETEAGAVYGEYRKNRTSPFFTAYEAMQETAYKTHTYGHTTMGYERDIKNMPKMFDYSRKFFQRYYRPDNAIIVVAGDIDPNAVFSGVEKHYADWKPGYKAPKVKPEPAQKKARRKKVSYDGRALPILWMAYKGDAFAPEKPTFVAAQVLGELAFGETSDLYKELVLEKQIVQSVEADAPSARDPGLFHLIAVVKESKDLETVEGRLLATIKQYQDRAPSDAVLEDVKSHMRYAFLMGLSSPNRVADGVARLAGIWGGVDRIEAFYQAIGNVTAKDVQDAAKLYLTQERSTTIILEGQK